MPWGQVATEILKSLDHFRILAVLTKITPIKFHGLEPSPTPKGVRKAFSSFLHNGIIGLGHWWRGIIPTQDNR